MKRIAYALVVAFGLTSAVKAEDVVVAPAANEVITEQALRNIETMNASVTDKAEAKSFVQKHKVLLIAAASAVVLFGTWTLVWYLKGDFTKAVPAVAAVDGIDAEIDEETGEVITPAVDEVEAVEGVPSVPTEKSWRVANWYQTVVATPVKRFVVNPTVKAASWTKGQFVNHPYRSTAITAGAILAIAATVDLLRGADKSIIRSMFKKSNNELKHPATSIVA